MCGWKIRVRVIRLPASEESKKDNAAETFERKMQK